jgi:hypothetical protein
VSIVCVVNKDKPKKASVTSTTRAAVTVSRGSDRPPATMRNSLRKTPKGGMADSARTAATNIGPLQGSAPTPPRIFDMSLVSNLRMIEPAPKKAVPFAAACARTCRSTPTTAIGAPKLMPMARIPMCSTLE